MTALVLHPDPAYNTFYDVAGADNAADDLLSHATWSGLSAEDKQRWLLFTGAIIKNTKGFKAPDVADDCLQKAQLALIIHQVENKIQEVGGINQQLRTRKFDMLYHEYFKNTALDNAVVPDIPQDVKDCLALYGAVFTGDTVGGIGTFGRYR